MHPFPNGRRGNSILEREYCPQSLGMLPRMPPLASLPLCFTSSHCSFLERPPPFPPRTRSSMAAELTSLSVKTLRSLHAPLLLTASVSSWRNVQPRNSSGIMSPSDRTRFSQPSRTSGRMGTWEREKNMGVVIESQDACSGGHEMVLTAGLG